MSRKRPFWAALLVSLLLGSFRNVSGETASPFTSGVTRDSNGKALGQVQVTARSASANTYRIVTSGDDGAYSVAGLDPGAYLMTAKAPGLASSPPISIEVTNRENSYTDLFLDKIPAAEAPDPPIAPANVSVAARPGFSAYRGYPAPVMNPPYPFTIWPMGGTVDICFLPPVALRTSLQGSRQWVLRRSGIADVHKKDFIAFRQEYFDDIKGQRTGFQTKYVESGIGWNHWIGSTLCFPA